MSSLRSPLALLLALLLGGGTIAAAAEDEDQQAEGDIEAETLGIPLSIYATRNFKVLVAAGVERQLFKDDETVLRLGLDYSFHVGRFTVAPTAAVDFVNDNEILFLGLALGRGF